MAMTRILIADDDKNLRKVLKLELSEEKDFIVDESEDGKEALELLKKNDYDVLLLDLAMPEMSGLEVMDRLRSLEIDAEIIPITGNATVSTAVEAMKLGAYDYITKPVSTEKLAVVIRKAGEKKNLIRENERLRSRLEIQDQEKDLITKSRTMLEVLEQVKKVAPSGVPVHIFGESGVGKELIARRIHTFSERSDDSFVAVNCAAINENIFESELFGHEKGAFTGADKRKPGLLEIADGGTFFIDEIGEMPLSLQTKLLRVLETGVYYRVGGVRETRVNTRIVSASNKDLREQAEEGRFREDLYWRICGITLKVPPLRKRKEDIPALIDYFKKQNRRFRDKDLSRDSLKLLKQYDWPGNVREFFNVIYRAFLLSPGTMVKPSDFPELIPRKTSTTPRSLESVEKDHIINVLEETNWHQGKTAEILDINPKTLYRKLKKYGIK